MTKKFLTGISTQGAVTIQGANSPINLPTGGDGSNGQVLASAGTGLSPKWITVSGGGSFTGGTLTSDLVLAAGSGTVEPLTFQTNSATPVTTSGAMDYDGVVFYQTSNTGAGRALATHNYYYVSSANYVPDYSTNGSAQSMLGAATRGIIVPAGTTYEYELQVAVQHQFITTGSLTGTFSIVNTTQTLSPVVSIIHTVDYGTNITSFATATTMSTVRTTGTVLFMPSIASGSRFGIVKVKGILRVTGTGTTKIYPALSLSGIAGDNVWTIASGLIFKMTPIGNGTVTTVGTWA